MIRFGAFLLGSILAVMPATLSAETKPAASSITCALDQLPGTAKTEPAGKLEAKKALNSLIENCAATFEWTPRQATSALLFSRAKIELGQKQNSWSKSELPEDVGDRIRHAMTLGDLNRAMFDGDMENLTKVISTELAVTGSVLHQDGRIDEFSAQESLEYQRALGGIVAALFMIEGFEKVFEDPQHKPNELFRLMNGLSPGFAALESRMQ